MGGERPQDQRPRVRWRGAGGGWWGDACHANDPRRGGGRAVGLSPAGGAPPRAAQGSGVVCHARPATAAVGGDAAAGGQPPPRGDARVPRAAATASVLAAAPPWGVVRRRPGAAR